MGKYSQIHYHARTWRLHNLINNNVNLVQISFEFVFFLQICASFITLTYVFNLYFCTKIEDFLFNTLLERPGLFFYYDNFFFDPFKFHISINCLALVFNADDNSSHLYTIENQCLLVTWDRLSHWSSNSKLRYNSVRCMFRSEIFKYSTIKRLNTYCVSINVWWHIRWLHVLYHMSKVTKRHKYYLVKDVTKYWVYRYFISLLLQSDLVVILYSLG